LSRVRIAGNRLKVVAADGSRGAYVAPPQFDRQVRAFGREGQALLNQLKIGVIGAGGTGSAVFEQLVRLGVGNVMLVDDDTVDNTNLSRIHESSAVDLGQAKVDVLARRAAAIGLGGTVTPIQARLRTPEVARRLVDRDLVFGCTDDDFGRAVLSRLAYWYLIPTIDMGFVVDADEAGIRDLFGRVTVVAPGTACLVCRRRVDARRVAWESLGSEERRTRVGEGYVPELPDPAPSVVTYTTTVAGLAVNEMLERLFGYGHGDAPSELLLRLADRSLNRSLLPPDPNHYCGDRTQWARGDEAPMLGLVWPSN
jgi:molybdopterin/thiamine biosynthesis adenylyltransferase